MSTLTGTDNLTRSTTAKRTMTTKTTHTETQEDGARILPTTTLTTMLPLLHEADNMRNTYDDNHYKRPKHDNHHHHHHHRNSTPSFVAPSLSSKEIVISLLDDSNSDNDDDTRRKNKDNKSTSTIVHPQPIINISSTASSSSSTPSSTSTFSLFRSTNEKRKLLFIRHGRTQGYDIIDTPLSREGIEQASRLLQNTPLLHQIDVLIVSPLSRALQTAVYAFANSNYLLVSQQQFRAFSTVTVNDNDNSSSSCSSLSIPSEKRYIPVYITPLAAERIGTLGDLGRSPGQILQNFPHYLEPLRDELLTIHSEWWRQSYRTTSTSTTTSTTATVSTNTSPVSTRRLSSSSSSSTSYPKIFHFPPGEQREDEEQFTRRVQKFRQFLHSLPSEYRTIGIIGHSVFIQKFTGQTKKLHFCESYRMNLE